MSRRSTILSSGTKRLQPSSASASIRRERLEDGGWPDGQVAQPNPGRRENRIGDGGRYHGRARLAEPNRSLGAVDELDVELGHITDAQRHVTVEVRILHLALDELRSLVEGHAQAPQRTAFDLRERAIRMNHCARVDDNRELFDRNRTAAAVDADARGASNPCGHGTF